MQPWDTVMFKHPDVHAVEYSAIAVAVSCVVIPDDTPLWLPADHSPLPVRRSRLPGIVGALPGTPAAPP